MTAPESAVAYLIEISESREVIWVRTRIVIADKLGEFLQGRPLGNRHFGRLCELVSEARPGDIVLLDFHGVTTVTGSWLNQAIVPFVRWAADERINVFPILLNVDANWLDDLQLVAQWTDSCFLVAKGNMPKAATLVGELDSAQKNTLKAVVEEHEVTGAQLERVRNGSGVKATAWNNRLKDLFDRRLIRRQRRGRQQVYGPVVPEIHVNG